MMRAAVTMGMATTLTGMLVACSNTGSGGKTATTATTAQKRAAAGATALNSTELADAARTAADTGSLGVIVRVDPGTGKPVEIARQAAWTTSDHRLSATDQFRVGSNTKTVTATLVLQEVADHRISLADTADKWLPGLVPNGKHITVRMLLNHTSGLGDFLLTPQFATSLTGQNHRKWKPAQLLAITPPQDPPAAPGEKYYYSNANYVALGLILEKSTGKSLDELIRQRITGPLGMKDSFLATSADWPTGKQHTTGYEPDAARLRQLLAPAVRVPPGVGFAGSARPHDDVNTTAIDPSWSWAAGAMVSTAEDWPRFLTALMSGKLLPKAQMEQMRTTVPAPEENGDYGLGLMKVNSPCGVVWGHTGGLPGYSSEIYTDGQGRRSVAVFTGTNFGIKEPKAAAANKKLVNTAICDMLGKTLPAEKATPAR
jgi:D-alanyl-D-alanine carboxypeptidase